MCFIAALPKRAIHLWRGFQKGCPLLYRLPRWPVLQLEYSFQETPLSLPDYLPFSNAHLNPIRSHIPEIGAAETFITFSYSSSSTIQPQISD